MGNLLIFIGQPKQAIDQVKEAIRLNPFHENWYVEYLGWAYEEAGMPKEAIEIFEQAIDLRNPDEDQLWYLPTIAAAYAHPTVGRMDDARKIVKTLLSRKPEYSISEVVSRYSLQDKGTHRQVCECGCAEPDCQSDTRLLSGQRRASRMSL